MATTQTAETAILELALPCEPTAPRAVRHQLLRASHIGPVMGDAALVASELVTNAVRHSCCDRASRVNVRVDRHNGCLRIAVRDPGRSGRAAVIADTPAGIGGLGLKLVESLTRRWGTERDAGGYTVWGELQL